MMQAVLLVLLVESLAVCLAEIDHFISRAMFV